MNKSILVLTFLLSGCVGAEHKISDNRSNYCSLSGQDWSGRTTDIARMKSYLLPMELDKPKDDAVARWAIGDKRFLAMMGLGPEFPGLDIDEHASQLCHFGYHFIPGTTDAPSDGEHADLQSRVRQYARKFNNEMLELNRAAYENWQ